ncbi:hypothetical protein JTB14_018631 [Gonioctena quinquepunctata]|nr:hypothetical protein JTB14_018631 [Gonioctena quinquepunctata]
MYSTPEHPQHWSVHAEFTITHPGAGNPSNPARTNTVQDDKGVRMLYSWSGDNPRAWSNNPSEAGSYRSGGDKQYAFQRGNLLFTSTPPAKATHPGAGPVLDSGYGSDLLSPSSLASSALPKTFNRKCRSTCNIILSKNRAERSEASGAGRSHCGRTQSLRCQTPSACCDIRGDNFYGCGDPWCHHLHYNDEFSATRRVSPVREVCEEFNDASHHEDCVCEVGREVSNRAVKRDVSVQTFEMVNKCTSPLLKMADSPVGNVAGKGADRFSEADEAEWVSRRRGNLLPRDKRSSGSDTKSGDSKRPRTIHIDVYCTGTDMESDTSCDSSTSSSHSKSASTPQTVFESEKMCVTHKKADDSTVPHHLSKSNDTSLDKDDSDDGLSSGYPSKMSSYSTMGQSLSSTSSFPNSARYSASSCTVPDYESSAANTSWKDTFSDIDSLLQSRNSIAANDSIYFVPRKIVEEDGSGCDTPKRATNSVSLNPSDSFSTPIPKIDCASSRWRGCGRTRTVPGRVARRECREADCSTKYILHEESRNVRRRTAGSPKNLRFSQGKNLDFKEPSVCPKEPVWVSMLNLRIDLMEETPQIVAPRRRRKLSLDPSLRSPFTILPGKYTESRFIAKKFGPVINGYRKPGHHVGPAKNPSCSCDHCRSYFKDSAARNRTCSVGDVPKNRPGQDWGDIVTDGQKYSEV